MKLNNTTNWVELNTTRFLTQIGNCVKKISCLALPGFKMVFTSAACMNCAVFLAFSAKKRLCFCSRGWIPPGNTDPALEDAAQPEGSQPSAPAQMLVLGLALQQLRGMDLSNSTKCPLCPLGCPLEMPTDSNFFSWDSSFPFPDHPASLILAEVGSGACSEPNEFCILTLQHYVLFEGIHICNLDNILSLLFYKVLYSPVC